MESLVLQIDQEVQSRSLLLHPFYRMWSRGELTLDHLSGYSKEYFQLVKAVPYLIRNIRSKKDSDSFRNDIQENEKEEIEHIELWSRFASSLGIPKNQLDTYKGLTKTIVAVEELRRLTSISLEVGVAAMYAYELELPKISSSKIQGLKQFYGLDSSDALAYFEAHEEADVRHAAVWRKILENVDGRKQESAFRGAVRSLAAQNKLLDSVMEGYVNNEQSSKLH